GRTTPRSGDRRDPAGRDRGDAAGHRRTIASVPACAHSAESRRRERGASMTRTMLRFALLSLLSSRPALAGQAPDRAANPDIPISDHDRASSAEQFSNTVTVTDPASNKMLGVIRLGDPQPGNLSPLSRGQLLVHGMGFPRARHLIAVVAIGSDAVIFI